MSILVNITSDTTMVYLIIVSIKRDDCMLMSPSLPLYTDIYAELKKRFNFVLDPSH